LENSIKVDLFRGLFCDLHLFFLILYEISLLQYSAVDTSPLSIYVMHPFWNYVVEVSSVWFRFWIVPSVVLVLVMVINRMFNMQFEMD